MTYKNKVFIASVQLEEMKRHLQKAITSLEQAQSSLIECDDISAKHPALSVTDGLVSVEFTLKLIGDMERMIKS